MILELLLLIVIGALIWAVVIYNRLINDKNRVLQAWSDIDVQLKRRHDLIPKLVEAVNAYAHYERQTLDEITRVRTAADTAKSPSEHTSAERALNGQMQRLIAVAEAYPELKADTQYLELLRQITEVEEHIQYARRFYNGSVKNLNVRIDSFPDLLVAQPFGFNKADFFEFTPTLTTTSGNHT